MIKEQMDLIVNHIKAHSIDKLAIKEFVCTFKFKGDNEFYLLNCNQLRVHSVTSFDKDSPNIVLSGNCKVDSS